MFVDFYLFTIAGETGYLAGRVPTDHTEYFWCASVHSYDMDRGDGRGCRGPRDSRHLLLYCKCPQELTIYSR